MLEEGGLVPVLPAAGQGQSADAAAGYRHHLGGGGGPPAPGPGGEHPSRFVGHDYDGSTITGLPGFDVSTWFGVFAPAGTPAPIVMRLNEAFTAALRTPEMRERLARMGAEPAPMTPEQFAQFVKAELAKYQKVVKFSGARVD